MDNATNKTPLRSEVSPSDTWDLSPMFSCNEKWFSEIEDLSSYMKGISKFKGNLSKEIFDALSFHFSCLERLENVYTYAHLLNDQDMTDNNTSSMLQKAQSTWVEYSVLSSFISPELISQDEQFFTLIKDDSRYQEYKVFIDELKRAKPYTKSENEENLLSMSSEVLSSSSKIFRQLSDADLSFEDVIVDKKLEPLTHSTFINFLLNPDRKVRKEAWEKYYKTFDAHKYSLSSILQSNLKKDTFIARARNYTSSKVHKLFSDNIPESVYDSLIRETSNGLKNSLHPYYELKKNLLNLDKLYIYDTYTPLISNPPKGVGYNEAVEILCSALSPLGDEYVDILKKGLTKDRWVDKYENKGKRSGAYSSGAYKSPPYILMNYKDTSVESLYTLAHEAGHSMHSYLSNRNQSFQNHSYTIFVAEVASTLNEILLTKYLLEKRKDDVHFCSYILNYQLDAIKGTFFRQTMFAEFEEIIHASSDKNEPITLEFFRSSYQSLLQKYFGSAVEIESIDDLECLRIPHFYSSFYVFKYATGISAAILLAENILSSDKSGKVPYLNFLSSGGSDYSMNLLKKAGVDLSTEHPFKSTINVFRETLKELSKMQDWKITL